MELTELEKQKVIKYLPMVKNKLFPNSLALEFLAELFKEKVDKSFSLSCGRCKRNLTSFWSSQIKNNFK